MHWIATSVGAITGGLNSIEDGNNSNGPDSPHGGARPV